MSKLTNRMIARIFSAAVCLLLTCAACLAQETARGKKILLIPLDDRPPCLQFPVRMGLIGDAEIVTPPAEMLGRFTTPGQTAAIAAWLERQDLKSFDAAIIALDMSVYGGLVASRVSGGTTETEALKRVATISELRRRAPQLKIYAQSVIMRLAPTGTGDNESYRQNLADWAEISVLPDEQSKARTKILESKIPAAALNDYKAARVRNLRVNLEAVELVRAGEIDYLILSQDDAKPRGIHVADRERLISEIGRLKLNGKIAVQPGADEVAMLLLARVMNEMYRVAPKIKAVYSSDELSRKTMPFEDKPLRETVSYHIKAVGGRETANEQDADILFYVYASRFEAGAAEKFADAIETNIKKGAKIIVADVDPRGDVQGGAPELTEMLLKRGIFPALNGYASWNTAGNTIGTALPQGAIYYLAETRLVKGDRKRTARIVTAENWFTFHRLLDDYYFHNPVRAAAKKYIAANNWSALRLSDAETVKVEDYALKMMRTNFDSAAADYFRTNDARKSFGVRCEKPSGLQFDLPWNRTFEAEINFNLRCR